MPAVEANPAKLPLRAATEANDITAILDSFAPDAVVHSPLTSKPVFTGRDQIGAVAQVILDVFDGLRYTGELRSQDSAFLVARARVDGQDIEMINHLRLGPDGKIREFTDFIRPLPATTAALRAIGAGLGRRESPARAAIISALARPLALMTRAGDRIGVRLVRSSLQCRSTPRSRPPTWLGSLSCRC